MREIFNDIVKLGSFFFMCVATIYYILIHVISIYFSVLFASFISISLSSSMNRGSITGHYRTLILNLTQS